MDGLVQEKRNSSALAMESRLSCTNMTNPSIWHWFSTKNDAAQEMQIQFDEVLLWANK